MKRILSLVVAALMALALVPAGAVAKGLEPVSPLKPMGPIERVSSGEIVTRSQTIAYSTDFETDPETGGWTFVDSDGDGRNWFWSNQKAHSGVGIIQSASFESSALYPDNWARSPQITVPNDKQYAYLSLYTIGQDPNYPYEVYRLYVTVNGQDIPISDDLTASVYYWQRIIDISAYAGQTVSFAIRHYNVSDEFRLNVDDFSVFSSDAVWEESDEPHHPRPDGCFEGYYFEDDYDTGRVFAIDADGDGNSWDPGRFQITDSVEGSFFMLSEDSNGTEDDWLLFRRIQIPASGAEVTFYAAGHSGTEHFAAYVITGDASSAADLDRAAEVIPETDVMEGWFPYSADLSAYAGQTVTFAIRHFNTANEAYLLIDQVEFWYAGMAPEKELPEGCFDAFYFEYPDEFYRVFCLDMDEDGYNWDVDFGGSGYEGIHCMYSESYKSGPDNWLLFTGVQIPSSGAAVTFWAKGGNSTYSAEHFAVYAIPVGSSGTVDMNNAVEVLAETETAYGWACYTADLSAFAGQTVAFAIRHFNCTDEYYLLVDQVEFWTGPAHELPDGCFDAFYFENDYERRRLAYVDLDGDYQNWFISESPSVNMSIEGTHMAFSRSWISGGGALTPDNWLLFRGVQIPADGASVTFWARSFFLDAGEEHFAAYVIPGDATIKVDLANAVEVVAETVTNTAWTEYSADLSAYAGQVITFAIRHFNCTDQLYIGVDMVEFWGEPDVEPHEYNDLLTGYYFEDPAELDHITFRDEDNDYETWFIADPSMGYGGDWFVAYEGEHCAASYSFIPDFGACSPNNSMEFEAVTVPEDGMAVTFWARNNVPGGGAEVFNAYVKTGGSSITVLADAEASDEWTKYTVDLYRFAGQEIVFGINHNMSGGNSALLVDQVEFWYNAGEPEITLGDVDCDGDVDFDDVTLLNAYLLNAAQISDQGLLNANVNGDTKVSSADVVALNKLILGSN